MLAPANTQKTLAHAAACEQNKTKYMAPEAAAALDVATGDVADAAKEPTSVHTVGCGLLVRWVKKVLFYMLGSV